MIFRNYLFNGIPRNFTEYRNLIPAELKKSVKFRKNSVERSFAAGHSNYAMQYLYDKSK